MRVKVMLAVMGAVAIMAAACSQSPAPAQQDTLLAVKSRTDALPSTPAAEGSRMSLTTAEENAIQSKILSDGTPFPGGRIDASISSRAAPGAQMALTPNEETAIQKKILSDGTPFPGSAVSALATAIPVTSPTIIYTPDVQDTGDLEPATRSITATAEASGTGKADYGAILTIPAPPDPRILVKAIAARQIVHVNALAGASHLYLRVYVDAQDSGHRLFDVDLTQADIDAVNVKVLTDQTGNGVFNLLKDGNTHTFYWYFWVNEGSASISSVELQEGIGASVYPAATAIEIDHTGLASLYAETERKGVGNTTSQWAYHDTLFPIAFPFNAVYCTFNGLVDRPGLQIWSDVPSDIVIVKKLAMVLRTN